MQSVLELRRRPLTGWALEAAATLEDATNQRVISRLMATSHRRPILLAVLAAHALRDVDLPMRKMDLGPDEFINWLFTERPLIVLERAFGKVRGLPGAIRRISNHGALDRPIDYIG